VPGPKEHPCNPGARGGAGSPDSGVFFAAPLGLAAWLTRRTVGGIVTRNVLRRHRSGR
jgi:hypothetical protein